MHSASRRRGRITPESLSPALRRGGTSHLRRSIVRLPFPPEIPRGSILIVEARLSRSHGLLGRLRDHLDDAELARAERFVHVADHQRMVLGRGLAREAIARYTGVDPGQVVFTATGEGKPTVVHGPAFNVAHSGDLVLLAIASAGRIGVDVEHARPLRNMASLARSTFRPAEAAAVMATPEPERLDAFYRVWTRKEALLKGLGHGLTALDSIEVSAAAGGAPLAAIDLHGESAARWTLRTVELDPQHPAAVARDAPIDDVLVLEV